jgi:hypothetical protein
MVVLEYWLHYVQEKESFIQMRGRLKWQSIQGCLHYK